MRAFIAIELDGEIKDAISRVQERLKHSGADVKWVERENMHLTLKFLGEIPDNIEVLSSLLDGVASKTKSFDAGIKDVGVFPKPEFPRVVWVDIVEGADNLSSLAQNIDDHLEGVGFQRESRPFTSHITIGRVRSAKNKKLMQEGIAAIRIEKPLSQKVKSIVLFKSHLTSEGPIYTKLHESPLEK